MHIKLIDLLLMINDQTNEFIPVSQFLINIFEHNKNYFESRPKSTLTDKMIPETQVSLKISKKHIDTPEMRERIIKEIIEMIT